MEEFFWIGLLLVLGYISKIIIDRLHLPSVTIYLLVGLLLSPSAFHVLPDTFMDHSNWIIEFALAIISFIIGGSINLEKIQHMRKTIIYITLFQAQLAFAVTFAGLYYILPYMIDNNSAYSDFIFYFSISMFLGALASTTAPTTTIAVIEEYKSKGIVTTALIAIVAIDDVLSIINYSLSVSAYSYIAGVIKDSGFIYDMFTIFWHIFGSVCLGVFFAFLTIFIISSVKNKNIISIGLGNILLVYTISTFLEFEALLSIMIFAFVLSNKSHYFDDIFEQMESNYIDIIFMLFFIVTGATIKISMLYDMGHIAVVYVFLRAFGKIVGSYIGAKLSNSKRVIRENVGFALLPQAGVAMGLAMLLYMKFPQSEITQIILNVILASTIIHEILGPFFTKFALKQAKEIKEEE